MRTDLQSSQQLVPTFLLGLDSSEGGALGRKGPEPVLKATSECLRDFLENLDFGRCYPGIALVLCSRVISKVALILPVFLNLHHL